MAETSPLVKMVRSAGSAAFEDKCFAVDGPVIIGRAGALAHPTRIMPSLPVSRCPTSMPGSSTTT